MRGEPFDPTAVILREELAQSDMQERARRLRAFKAATEGKVWRYNAFTGQWRLVRVLAGTKTLPLTDAA